MKKLEETYVLGERTAQGMITFQSASAFFRKLHRGSERDREVRLMLMWAKSTFYQVKAMARAAQGRQAERSM